MEAQSEKRKYTQHQLEEAVLELLRFGDVTLGHPGQRLVSRYAKELKVDDTRPEWRVAEAICELVCRGLVYVDFSGSNQYTDYRPADWCLLLTERGKAAAGDTTINPDMPQDYLEQFAHDMPQAPLIVHAYIKEALETYRQRCYMACAVMLGVAAEASVFDLLESFCQWLPPNEGNNLRAFAAKRGTFYSTIHEEFRKRFDKYKRTLPVNLVDGIDLQLNAVLDLIRVYRNDAGHPTGKTIDRKTCHVSLVQFAYAVQRLYALKVYFDSNKLP